MLEQVFATKRSMTQAWTKSGKRVAVTCLNVMPNAVIAELPSVAQDRKHFQVGYGTKKLKNTEKPLRSQLEKGGFSFGVRLVKGVAAAADSSLKVGDTVRVEQVLEVGDVVKVQGTTKGRGFAGAMKRHGFSGQPKTHGQSDRWRAVGAIGQRTTPGRVFKGKRMPGHYGVELQTVVGLVVLHINPQTQELWLSGPIPGHLNSTVTITKTGAKKTVELDVKSSNLVMATEEVAAATPVTPEAQTEANV